MLLPEVFIAFIPSIERLALHELAPGACWVQTPVYSHAMDGVIMSTQVRPSTKGLAASMAVVRTLDCVSNWSESVGSLVMLPAARGIVYPDQTKVIAYLSLDNVKPRAAGLLFELLLNKVTVSEVKNHNEGCGNGPFVIQSDICVADFAASSRAQLKAEPATRATTP